MFDFGMDPQMANEAPRHFCFDGELALEPRIPDDVAQAWQNAAITRPEPSPHGGCQAIYIDDENGVLVGGSDPAKTVWPLGISSTSFESSAIKPPTALTKLG